MFIGKGVGGDVGMRVVIEVGTEVGTEMGTEMGTGLGVVEIEEKEKNCRNFWKRKEVMDLNLSTN
jgi:hypothetical protein